MPLDRVSGVAMKSSSQSSVVKSGLRVAGVLCAGLAALYVFMVSSVWSAQLVFERGADVAGDPLKGGIWPLLVFAAFGTFSLLRFTFQDLPALIANWFTCHSGTLAGLLFVFVVAFYLATQM